MNRITPSLTSLAAFEAAARHISFTRAAEELGITQSAVSRQIRQLEDYLGIALFERVRRRVVLTDSAAAYVTEIRTALGRIEAATTDLVTSVGKGGVINIASLATFAASWLAPRMVSFVRAHPDISFNITAYHHGLADIEDRNIDVAIYFGEPSWPGTVSDRLMREVFVPMCTPEYMRANKLRTIGDLARVTLIQQSSRPDAWRDWFARAGRPDINALRGPRFEHYSMVIEAALTGLGIATIPRFLVEPHLASGRLVIPFDIEMRSRYDYYLVYPEAKRRLPKVQAFRRWIQNQARQQTRTESAVVPAT
ncbi:MAG: transcriptional regulator GcvA [Alphaproteobacteria bacterium]